MASHVVEMKRAAKAIASGATITEICADLTRRKVPKRTGTRGRWQPTELRRSLERLGITYEPRRKPAAKAAAKPAAKPAAKAAAKSAAKPAAKPAAKATAKANPDRPMEAAMTTKPWLTDEEWGSLPLGLQQIIAHHIMERIS